MIKFTRKHNKELNLWLLDLSSSTKKPESPSPDNSNQGGSPWQIIIPVGIIMVGLMAVVVYFASKKEKK